MWLKSLTFALVAILELSVVSSFGVLDKRPVRSYRSNQVTEDAFLTFIGHKKIASPPVTESDNLFTFFCCQANRNLLFFQNNVTEVTHITPSLIRTWDEEAKLAGGTGPSSLEWFDEGTNIHDTSTRKEYCQVIQIATNLNMPGLTILSQSTIGAKLIESDLRLPEYQFTLLDSKLEPVGPAPLVWLFNQLTSYRSKTSSFTRVRAQRADRLGHQSQIQLVTEARLETRVRVPAWLAKTFSARKLRNFEDQGSNSVQSMLEAELEPALMRFYQEYCNFVARVTSFPTIVI